jgi:hypothetical protein
LRRKSIHHLAPRPDFDGSISLHCDHSADPPKGLKRTSELSAPGVRQLSVGETPAFSIINTTDRCRRAENA